MILLSPMLAPKPLRVVKAVAWITALLPFLRIVFLDAIDQLGANPLEFITRSTGTWMLMLLCCTLAITPLRRIMGMN